MIKLTKLPEPQVLIDNGAQWLNVLETKIAAGEAPTDTEKSRYRHSDIKSVLKLETHGKCAYCESYLLHIAFGDVEHITPKSYKLSKIFEWSNLTLACDVCNTFKTDAVDLVDPYVDEPNDYFRFVGPMIYAKPEHAKGVATAKKLRLNRLELIQDRSKRLDAISTILFAIKQTSDQNIKSVLIDDLLNNEAADNNEFAAFVRSFIDHSEPGIKGGNNANDTLP